MQDLMPRLVIALSKRGYTAKQIHDMSPIEAVREYAAWHLGDPEWGRDFYELVHNAEAVLKGVQP